MAATTVPVTVTAEAAAHVKALGLEVAFQTMLEHTRQAVPGLRFVKVTLEHDPYPGGEPAVTITASREHPGPGEDWTARLWDQWLIATFSADVGWHFVFLPLAEWPC
jgi:hypothetical protein